MTTKIQHMKSIIERNPPVLGRDKHQAIFFAIDAEFITPSAIAEVATYDRAWRKVLQEYPDLDHRDSTRAQELAVQRDLGYNV